MKLTQTFPLRSLSFIWTVGLMLNSLHAQYNIKETSKGAYSPNIWASSVSLAYGISPRAILGLDEVFSKEYPSSTERREQVVKLVRTYQSAINQNPSQPQNQLMKILGKEIRGQTLELLSEGIKSPTIVANGNVEIEYGISTEAFWSLYDLLASKEQDLESWEKKFEDLLLVYQKLEKELAFRTDDLAQEASKLLQEGKLEEALNTLKNRYAQTLENVKAAELAQAEAAFDYGQVLELNLKYREATIIYKDAVNLDPTNSKYLGYYGLQLSNIADYDSAIKYTMKALHFDSISANPNPVGNYYNNLGIAFQGLARYDSAIEFYLKSLSAEDLNTGPNNLPDALTYSNLGSAYLDLAEYDKALEYFTIGLTILKEDPFKASYIYSGIATAYQAKGRYEEAVSQFEKALITDTLNLGNAHPKVASDFNNLGSIYVEMGFYDTSIQYFSRSLSIDTVILGNNHPKVATTLNNLGISYMELGKYHLAEGYYKRAISIQNICYSTPHPDLAISYSNLGEVYTKQKKYRQALECHNIALDVDTIYYEKPHPRIAKDFINIGTLLVQMGKSDEGITEINTGLNIFKENHEGNQPYIAAAYSNLASALIDKREYLQAIEFQKKALNIDDSFFGKSHPNVAIRYNNLGYAYYKSGQQELAIFNMKRALGIWSEKLPSQHPNIIQGFRNISRYSYSLGNKFYEKDQIDSAQQYFESAYKMTLVAQDSFYAITCLNRLIRCKLEIKDYDSALHLFDKGIELAQKEEAKSETAKRFNMAINLELNKGALFSRLGRKEEANTVFEQLYKKALQENDRYVIRKLEAQGYKSRE